MKQHRNNKAADTQDDEGNHKLTVELRRLLGDDGYQILLENVAGQRLFIPPRLTDELVDKLTLQVAEKLCGSPWVQCYVKVPLDREFLFLRYADMGFTNRHIAHLLHITESGVEKLSQRLRAQA